LKWSSDLLANVDELSELVSRETGKPVAAMQNLKQHLRQDISHGQRAMLNK
jgi:hypothetical protein